MLTIRDLELDFDLTSPGDMLRLDKAQKAAVAKEADLPEAPADKDDPEYLIKYAEWLNGLLNIFGNFIDDAFGDGVAEHLLTNNPSLTKMFDINDELEAALGSHVQVVTNKFAKYKPNRASRRGKK